MPGGAVQQHGDLGAGRLFGLAEHQDPRLRRALPVDMTQRLTGLMRPDASEFKGAGRRRRLLPAPVVSEAYLRIEGARVQEDDAGVDGDPQGIADTADGRRQPQRVFGRHSRCRDVMDPPVDLAHGDIHHLLLKGGEALDLQFGVLGSQTTERGHQRQLGSRQQPGTVSHQRPQFGFVPGDGTVGRKDARHADPPTRGDDQQPGHEDGGGEGEREQIQLPGSHHPSGQVGTAGQPEQRKAPCRGSRHTSSRFGGRAPLPRSLSPRLRRSARVPSRPERAPGDGRGHVPRGP